MRYIEILAEVVLRIDLLLDGEQRTEYNFIKNKPVMNLSEFTRENVAKWFDTLTREHLDGYTIKDFHVVFDDMEIPWAAKESRDQYEEAFQRRKAMATHMVTATKEK